MAGTGSRVAGRSAQPARDWPPATRYTQAVAIDKTPLRMRFEAERRRAAFIAFLPGGMTGIIVADTWISPWLGIMGGTVLGLVAYLTVYGYETWMWRKNHGR